MNLRGYLISFICLGLIAALFYGIFDYYNSEPNWWEVGDENIGTVYKISYGRSGGAWIEHEIDGELYRAFQGINPEGLVVGEKYRLKYLPDQPEVFQVLDYRPLFTEEENTYTTQGLIMSINRINFIEGQSTHSLAFTYNFEGRQYRRAQRLPPNTEQRLRKLKAGQNVEVVIWVENPQRAIVVLED